MTSHWCWWDTALVVVVGVLLVAVTQGCGVTTWIGRTYVLPLTEDHPPSEA